MADVPAALTFRTKTWVAEKLRDHADAEGRSVSNFISRIVEEWVLREGGVEIPSSKEKVEEDGEV